MLRYLQALYGDGTLSGLTDRQLLERFRSANREQDHDDAELAFTTMVHRHAAMVWRVCRSLVRDAHDAEDAFQATFLILVRKAESLRVRETLGPWLYVVAYRTGLSTRSSSARRREVERSAAVLRGEAVERTDRDEVVGFDQDLAAAIHAQIMRLPEASRAVVVLCDFEGLSYLEAARQLDLPLGTLQSRLARARVRLRRGLIRQGITMPASSRTGDTSSHLTLGMFTAVGLPHLIARRAARLCALVTSDPAGVENIVTGSVQALIGGGLRSMFFGNLKRVLLNLVGVSLVCGALLHSYASSGQPAQDIEQTKSRSQPRRAEEKKLEVPAPRDVKVAGGRGKILIYALDENEERIRLRPEEPRGNFKEIEREVRWAVVTGTIDHRKVRESFQDGERVELPARTRSITGSGGHGSFQDGGRIELLKARGMYTRVELQRQILQKDGKWSAWKKVDMVASLRILDNVPEIEAERTSEELRPGALVDPLPFLKEGHWSGVDVEQFIRIRLKTAKESEIGLMGSRGKSRPAGPPEAEPPSLMLRTLDFTVESGQTYRYRSRVVYWNPRWKQGAAKVVFGPWSSSTEIVTIP